MLFGFKRERLKERKRKRESENEERKVTVTSGQERRTERMKKKGGKKEDILREANGEWLHFSYTSGF